MQKIESQRGKRDMGDPLGQSAGVEMYFNFRVKGEGAKEWRKSNQDDKM